VLSVWVYGDFVEILWGFLSKCDSLDKLFELNVRADVMFEFCQTVQFLFHFNGNFFFITDSGYTVMFTSSYYSIQ